MDELSIRGLYDDTYAGAYDERFLTGQPWAAHGAEYEVELLGELLTRYAGPWLDVACGTGWFLAHFPEQKRAGLDLSPAMLARARASNPGIDLIEGSYLDARPDWVDSWSLVSCMWFAYAYVDTVAMVEEVVANLARWTSPDGACFVPVCDLEDLSGGTNVPYLNPDTWTFGGPLRIEAFVWSWTDADYDKHHHSLVCPHLDAMVEAFGRWFEAVEVVRYPPFQPGWGSRKAIVATSKRATGDAGPPTRRSERHEPYRGELPDEPTTQPVPDAPEEDGSTTGDIDPVAALGPLGRAWFKMPQSLRHGIRSVWRIVPARLRRRVLPER